MRWVLLFLVLMGQAMADPLTEAQVRFRALTTYQVTLRSTAADGDQHEIRYFYRKPGWVRMEFVRPHPGVVLIYDPGTRRARVWPFGLHRTFSLSLAPDNRLLRGPNGRRVDRSDVGLLLARLLALRAQGGGSPLGEAEIRGRPAIGLEIVGAASEVATDEHRYRVWLARDTLFPLQVESFHADGTRVETVDMTDAQIDVALPEQFFMP